MSKDYGNLGMSEQETWNNPCEDFLEMKQDPDLEDEEGVTVRRLDTIRRVIKDGRDDGRWKGWDEFVPDWQERGDPDLEGQLKAEDGIEFYNHLREAGVSKYTAMETHLSILQQFLNECMKRGVVDANPAAYVLDQLDNPGTEKNYPEVTVRELGDFLKSIKDPQLRAGYTTMAKLAIRIGEALNIDLPFLHLDHPIYYDYIESQGIELNESVEDYPDSLYIPSEPTVDEEFRGEIRKCGNKTEKGKLLPIDRETKRVLLDWIAVRPNIGHPYPLFYSATKNKRPRSQSWLRKLKAHLREYGLAVEYVEDDGKNMDLHYFRHFFSTNMQDGEGTYENGNWTWAKVKIIRGDIGINRVGSNGSENEANDSLRPTYTHNWGDAIRDPYLKDIYQFGIYD